MEKEKFPSCENKSKNPLMLNRTDENILFLISRWYDTSSRLFPFSFQIPKNKLLCYPVLAWREPSLWHLHVHWTSYCIIHTQINTPSLSLTKQTKPNPYPHTQLCFQSTEKINMETFQNFKSQCSVTKHIIPLIKLTYYTYEWCCLKTLKPQLLEVWSQQGDLWDYCIINRVIMFMWLWKHPKTISLSVLCWS